jgi:hypothetical protein
VHEAVLVARKSIAQKKKAAKKSVRGVENPFEPTSKPSSIAYLVFEGAKLGAEILIDRDPANIFKPDTFGNTGGGGDFSRPAQSRKFISADEALERYRREPQRVPVTVETLQMLFDAQPNPEQAYNDARDLAEINQDQELENALAKLSKTRPTKFTKTSAKRPKTSYGSGRFQSQFGQNMGFNFSQMSKPKRKRTPGEKAADKKLSKAFKKANMMCRKKNGQFKKGKSQKDVAKCAHRLRKKMN